MNTGKRGRISELLIIVALEKEGCIVLEPVGDERFDLAIYIGIKVNGEKLIRVQCKTGRAKNGVIKFSTSSQKARSKKQPTYTSARRDYRGDAELFAVWVPEFQQAYLVPVTDVGIKEGVLRYEKPKNKQIKKVRYAQDYELSPMIKKLKQGKLSF